MTMPASVGRTVRVVLFILVSALIVIQFAPSSAQDTTPFPTLDIAPATPQAQVFQASTSQHFYYYEGQRVTLELAPELVAVRFKPGDLTQQRAAVSQLRPALQQSEATEHRNPDYTLYRVPSLVSAQGALDLVNQLRQNRDLVQWANPVFRVPGGYAVLTDEFIARFPDTWNEEQIRSFNAGNGVELVSRLLSNDNAYVLRVTGTVALNGVVGVDAMTMANLYYENGYASYAEPNFSNQLKRLFTPNDPAFGQQWALNNTGQTVNGIAAGTSDADIDAPEAWDITTGSNSIIIAIIDDAYDSTHPDLGTGTSKMVPGYDAFSGVGGIFPVPGEDEAHGTATAGLAAAIGNNSQGVSGVCSGCRIMPIQVFNEFGAATNAQFANGINYAWQNGADVLSNSWGGGSVSTAITNAINAALSSGRGGKGSVVVFAAGNDNLQPVSYPGSLTQVITVSASNLCDQRKAPTSNACNYFEYWWGPNSGPENDISAPGVGLYTTDIVGTDGYSSTSYYPHFNGTSGATPIVSGVVGLMLSVNPNLTAVQIQQRVKANADDINTPGFDNGTGWGRINALRAVQSANRNDLITYAAAVTLPSANTRNPYGSTTSPDDPTSCGGGVNTVWFRYDATATKPITINTIGSTYDTILSVYTGNPGSLTMVGCDDNSGVTTTSSVGLNVTNGTRYFIMVAKSGSTPLGAPATLALNLVDVPTGDTLALYNTTNGASSLIDTLQDLPPAGAYNNYTPNAPFVSTFFVMGDWDGDGQQTPGTYLDGAFRYTNGIGPNTTWFAVWVGAFPSVYPVAGRFDPAVNHDCFGVVQLDYPVPNVGFPMHYHCNLSVAVPPGGLRGQWLGIVLPGSEPYQFVTGDWNNDGLDSLAGRRGEMVAFGNVAPAQGVGTFPLAQYLGTPHGGSSLLVAGDWDNNGIDSFGLFYPGDGYFYRKNNLEWNTGAYLVQRVGLPIGTTTLVDSWRAYSGSTFSAPVPNIEETAEVEMTETVEATEAVEVTEAVEATPEVEVTETMEATEVVEPTETPSPFPTLPLEGPSEPTITPTPFPTLPLEEPGEPSLTPLPTPQYLSLPAHASMDDGALDWQRSAGWLLTPEAAFGGLGAGWHVSAANTVEALRWSLPLDLRTIAPGQTVELTYLSRLNSAFSSALVQVSLDGTNWFTVGEAAAGSEWTVETVDLTSFTGQLLYVQFVWNGVLPEGQADAVDTWWLDEVNVAALAPVGLPSATATATVEQITVEPPTATPTETPLPSATPLPTATPTETQLPAPETTSESSP